MESSYLPVGSLRLNPGTYLFVLDVNARKLFKAAVVAVNDLDCYEIPPGCRFVVALNAKNADRKFYNLLTGNKKAPN